MRRAAAALVMAAVLAIAGDAHAHPLGFAIVSIRQTDARTADVVVRVSGTESDPGRIALAWPAGCDERVLRDEALDEVRERRSTVTCAMDLEGIEIGIDGPARGLEVRVETALRERDPSSIVVHALPARAALGRVTTTTDLALAHARLGALHFALGIDHVLFVAGAFLLARARGLRAVATVVTAFTIGHAITLAIVALGAATIPTRPVEACIALSLVHVARELRTDARTLTKTAPAIVCGLFGLVHGAGLASVMSEAGLRGSDLALAVASFNVGLELAELALVVLLFAIVRDAAARGIERVVPFAIGGIGCALFFERIL